MIWSTRNKALILGAIIFFSIFFAQGADAATNIYYSVGSNTSDHKTGTPTITIDGSGVATFSVPQTSSSTGVGNIINYGGQRAFITGKVSTSVWNVSTATGTLPAATTSASVTSITHAFSSLNTAIGRGVSGNASSTSFLGTDNLVTGDYILNIPAYNDTGAGSSVGNVAISGFTATSTNYIRVYTPTSTSTEVNASQRHAGVYNTAVGYNILNSVAGAISVVVPYTKFDGIQFRNNTGAGVISITGTNVTISNSIFYASVRSTAVTAGAFNFTFVNNVISGFNVGLSQNTAFIDGWIYNNTFYDNITGYLGNGFASGAHPVLKNNIFASTSIPISVGARAGSGSDYNATATSSLNYTVTGGGNTHDRVNQTFTFVDAANGDFHLAASDAGARNYGADLSAVATSSFSIDIDGQSRPGQSGWDIGADEYIPTGVDEVAPIITQISTSSAATTATITWDTDEPATSAVNYGTTSGYGSASTSASLVVDHSITITGLSENTTYHIQISTADASGNTATSSDYIITTLDATGPIISNVASSTNAISATITWTTDESASSTVNYGETTSYGTASSSAVATTTHSTTLTGLTSGMVYHFQIVTRDASGNTATSTDYTFFTNSDGDVPVISSVASYSSAKDVIIVWATDEAATSTVDYGTTVSYGSASSSAVATTTHRTVITGLDASTEYHFRITTADIYNNVATSSDYTFTTDSVNNIYYSVGQNTSDHKTGSPTLAISDGVATFSIAQTATNMGVGDKITYNTTEVAYISGKISATEWNVTRAAGGSPVDVSGAIVNSITHAYASLYTAVGNGVSNNATSSSKMNTSNLVTGNFMLNIPVYNDGGADAASSNMTIGGYTTGLANYIRVYTPTSTTTEVNQSQRHNGTFNTAEGYAMVPSVNAYALTINTPYTVIDGLQFRNNNSRGAIVVGASNVKVMNNIFSALGDNPMIYARINNLTFFNNIVIDATVGIEQNTASISGEVYNNTFYNTITGVLGNNFGTRPIYKNNLFASTTNSITGWVANGSDYNATASTSIGYTVIGGGNTHDRVSQTFTFFDVANDDVHLASTDTGARNFGVDLSATTTTDVDGQTRPGESVWDIGADEYISGLADESAPGRSGGYPSSELPAGTTQSVISLTTNENAVCKYSDDAGVAYDSMSETFTTTGGTAHSFTLSDMQDGQISKFYVKCSDSASNTNADDYEITAVVEDSGIVYANSCSISDVNVAYGYTEVGDTLRIPPGICSGYSSSAGLAVGKAITVEGSGRGVTILEIASTTGSFSNPIMPLTAPATVKSMTIRAITSGNSGTLFSASAAANGFRITDIEYINAASTTNGYFANISGYGLIDNVDVTGGAGNNELIFVRGPTNSWQTDESMGTTQNVIIENSIFRNRGYVTDCNSNSRCVVRNNLITGPIKIDGHGLASNSPARGVRHMEVYNNTWTSVEGGGWAAIELRGGTGMVFNNTAAAGGLVLHEYGATASWPNFGSVIQTVDNYPITDQIGVGKDPKVAASEPMYLWDNERAGSLWTINLGYGNAAQLNPIIMPERDYYMSSTTAFNGTAGVGIDTLANRPATCTTGVGYFATDGGTSWNAQNGTSSDGTLFKCTSTNTWTEYYTPYALPHYLTASSTVGTDEIDIGAGARIFGNGSFYDIATSSQSGTFADLSVTPGSTTDAWVDVHVSTWENSGTRLKVWTESMPSLNSTSTYHVVGDLAAGESYSVKVDDVLGDNISGPDCTDGVCVANGSGEITFTYSGGYSEHEFEVEQTSPVAPDTDGPIISSVASSTGQTVATVTWTTDESSDSKVSYGTSAGTYTTSTSSASLVDVHSIGLTGLSASTRYYFVVVSKDASDNVSTSSEYSLLTASTPDITAPIISSVASSTGVTTATITWNTDEAASSTVNYGATSSYGSASSSATLVTSHTVTLTGLTAGTIYHFNVGGADAAGNVSTSTDYVFITTAAPDITGPVISSVASSTGQTTATVTWTTDESSDSKVSYGTSAGTYTTSTSSASLVTSHSLGLTGLSVSTRYYFVVVSKDASDNISTSSEYSLLTASTPDITAPVLSEVTAIGTTTDTTPSYTFSSDEAGTISYGGSCSSGTTSASSGNNTVTFTTLAVGTYADCTITVTDASDNASDPLSVTSFTIEAGGEEEEEEVPSSGGGGGGGGSSRRSSSSHTVIETTVPFATSTPASTLTSASTTISAYVFTRDLTIGSEGADVTALQNILIAQGYLVMPSGIAQGYFGNLTQSALIRFQTTKGIAPTTGYFGPITRAYMNGNQAPGYIVPVSNTSTSLPVVSFSRDLTVDSQGPDVIALQNILINEGYLMMPPGVEKGYFGLATKEALIKYQQAKGIVPAIGYFGPVTRGIIGK